jgi:hypothetical protein
MSAHVDTHRAEVTLRYDVDHYNAGTGVRVALPTPDALTLSEDIDRSPYTMGSVTIPRPSEFIVGKLDPRGFPVLELHLYSTASVTHHLPAKTSDVTAALFPGPLSDVTDQYAGADPGSMSRDFAGTDVTTVLTPGVPDTHRYVELLVTDVSENIGDNTVTIGAAGLEVLLDFWSNISPLPADLSEYGASVGVSGIVNEVLRRVGLPSVGVWSGTSVMPEADAMYWQPGQSAHEFIEGLLEFNDQRIYAESGYLLRVAPTGEIISGGGFPNIDLDYREGMTSATRSLAVISSRNEYFDAVLLLYKWKDSAGVDQLAFDRYPRSAPYRKSLVLQRDRAFPGIGAAQGIYNRSRKRGGDFSVTRVSRYNVTCGWDSTLLLPGEPRPRPTSIKGITWTFPAAEMTLRLEQKAG